MAENSVIEIDDRDDFIPFRINGYEFEVDLCAAADRMSDIDLKHKNDPDQCLACGQSWVPKAEAMGKDDRYFCPHCQARGIDKIRPAQSFLDDVAAYLVSLGVPRPGRKSAAEFYNKIVELLNNLKKNTSLTPESDTGSTLTADGGATEESGPT